MIYDLRPYGPMTAVLPRPALGRVLQRPLSNRLGQRTCLFSLGRSVKQPLADSEVPHGDNDRRHQFCNVRIEQVGGVLAVDGTGRQHHARCDPDDHIVDEKPDCRRDEKDQHLHPLGHVVPASENEMHAREIIENQRDDEGYGCGKRRIHVESGDQQIHESVIDDEADSTHDTEFEKLGNQIFHIANLHTSSLAAAEITPNAASSPQLSRFPTTFNAVTYLE